MSRKPRLDDIDSAKGLAIFLVVLGHLVGGEFRTLPRGFDWYMAINHAIYRFHMPFFMFLSGLIFFYTYNPIRTLRDFGHYVVRKFWRFGPAYLLFGGLMIAGKVIGQRFLHVDSPPESFWRGFEGILLRPMTSHAASLWDIYALLVFQMLFPIALRFSRDRLEPLLVVGLVLHFVGSTPLLCLVGLEKGLLEKFHLWTGWLFVFFAPLLLLSGLFVPILLKAFVFPRIPSLDRITS